MSNTGADAESLASHALAVIDGRTQVRDIPKRVRKMAKLANRSGLEIDSQRPLETLIAIDVFLAGPLDDSVALDEGRNHLIPRRVRRRGGGAIPDLVDVPQVKVQAFATSLAGLAVGTSGDDRRTPGRDAIT